MPIECSHCQCPDRTHCRCGEAPSIEAVYDDSPINATRSQLYDIYEELENSIIELRTHTFNTEGLESNCIEIVRFTHFANKLMRMKGSTNE